jgi:hypothetical protein
MQDASVRRNKQRRTEHTAAHRSSRPCREDVTDEDERPCDALNSHACRPATPAHAKARNEHTTIIRGMTVEAEELGAIELCMRARQSEEMQTCVMHAQ